jgi:hypothetical protein
LFVRIAEVEFAAIVTGAQAIEPKRRFFLADGSFENLRFGRPTGQAK